MGPTRRTFILGSGSALLLAACSSDKGGGSSSDGQSTEPSAGGTIPENGFAIAQRFPNSPLFTPGEVRLAVSLVDSSGTLMATGPAELKAQIVRDGGGTPVDLVAKGRGEGISPMYYEVRATLPDTGTYTLRLEGDDGNGAAFAVYPADQIASPSIGSPMPPFDTPTVDDHRGVEPYCSLTPSPCPLHDVTLTEALQSGKPVVYMIGTPAHCQTGTCAPGLEFLVTQHGTLGDAVVMVHADVYADEAATTIAPAVDALKVDYEPIVYFIGADGVIVDRLDAVWDSTELADRMALFLKA